MISGLRRDRDLPRAGFEHFGELPQAVQNLTFRQETREARTYLPEDSAPLAAYHFAFALHLERTGRLEREEWRARP